MTLFDARMNSNTICVLVSLRLTREPATDKRRSERSACDEPNGGLRSPALAPSEMSADASPPLILGRRRNLARRERLRRRTRAAQLPPPSHPPTRFLSAGLGAGFASPIGHHAIAMIASYRTDSGPGEPVRDFAYGVAHA
jgi:hypothetical protein